MKLPEKVFYLTKELGLNPLFLLGCYRAAIASGVYRLQKPISPHVSESQVKGMAAWMPRLGFQAISRNQVINFLASDQENILQEAALVMDGTFRPYGGDTASITLTPSSLPHWSRVSTPPGMDIKDIWEPARFCWVYPLIRAYSLTGDERYPEKFWELFTQFINANPINFGPHWMSGQEIAIRIIQFTFAGSAFWEAPSTTQSKREMLLTAILNHATRLPSTLIYARAQNNNHLLVEAAGLITAGLIYQPTSAGKKWLALGWKWFHRALQNQIFAGGVYIQYSTNYHRLMLQTAIWIQYLSRVAGMNFPQKTVEKLKEAVNWLSVRVDPITGKTPNLGHNDGAYLQPLCGEYADYRPVVQTASRLFCRQPAFSSGPWDEMSAWFDCLETAELHQSLIPLNVSGCTRKIGSRDTWAFLQAEKFQGRPAHADQLHVDLWWKGKNIAMDPGTYRYNAQPPFDNSLARTGVHNTIEIQNQDQMIRAGRFLWLRRASAKILLTPQQQIGYTITAEHDGYKTQGFSHRRSINWDGKFTWIILDEITPIGRGQKECQFVISWLVPDLAWEFLGETLILQSEIGRISLRIQATEGVFIDCKVQLIRSGKLVFGEGQPKPHQGWVSPTYGKISPALAYRAEYRALAPVKITSTWLLDDQAPS